MATAAQLVQAAVVLAAVAFGFFTSMNQALVGAMAGAGFARGRETVHLSTLLLDPPGLGARPGGLDRGRLRVRAARSLESRGRRRARRRPAGSNCVPAHRCSSAGASSCESAGGTSGRWSSRSRRRTCRRCARRAGSPRRRARRDSRSRPSARGTSGRTGRPRRAARPRARASPGRGSCACSSARARRRRAARAC